MTASGLNIIPRHRKLPLTEKIVSGKLAGSGVRGGWLLGEGVGKGLLCCFLEGFCFAFSEIGNATI